MPKQLNKESSIEDIDKEYQDFKREFDKFVKSFNDKSSLLKHSDMSQIYPEVDVDEMIDNIDLTIENINKSFLALETAVDSNKKTFSSERTRAKLIEALNDTIMSHKGLSDQVNLMKQNIPIMQTVKFYIHKAMAYLWNIGTTVVNFIMKASPSEATKTTPSLTSCFTKFRTSGEKSVSFDETVPHPTRPDII